MGWHLRLNFTWGQFSCCLKNVKRGEFISLTESNGPYFGKPGSNILRLTLTLTVRQDLNSSILTGSSRIVDHTTFAELQWTRDPFSPKFFRLPSGFQTRSHLFTKEFIEVLEDIHALQCIRDLSRVTEGDVLLMARINNHTASIQSRLVDLPNLSPVLECCYLAAYVCSVMLCCKVWCALVIPVGKLRTFA